MTRPAVGSHATAVPTRKPAMRINTIEVHELKAPRPQNLPRPQHRTGQMADLYDQALPVQSESRIRRLYLRVGTDVGIAGLYGPIDEAAADVIKATLADVVLGSNPLAINLLHERMLRCNRHIRTGQGSIGRSAIDNVLWDIRGRALETPVYELLGGATRTRVPAYASTLGCSHDKEELTERSKALACEYPAQKWFFAPRAADPARALQAAVELAELLRASVGADYPLMYDAVMSWDLHLARAWAPTEPTWLEEPFPAYNMSSYRLMSESTSVPLAFGEHLYNRWEANGWLQSRTLEYLQCDPEWCGGTSESVRIATLCSTNSIRFVPHGHNLHAALHLVASQPPWLSPYVEYLTELADARHFFERQPPKPVGGSFDMPTIPGFGIELIDDPTIVSDILWQTHTS